MTTISFAAVCLPHRKQLIARARRLWRSEGRHASSSGGRQGLNRDPARSSEDLVQDTFVRALQAWPRFQAEGEGDLEIRVGAWLNRILLRVFLDRYRRERYAHRRRRECRVDIAATTHAGAAAAGLLHAAGSAGGDDERAIDAPLLRALYCEQPQVLSESARGAVAALPEMFRSVVEAVDLEGLFYREVAEDLGLPIGTVMSRLHRGRRILAAELEEHAADYGLVR